MMANEPGVGRLMPSGSHAQSYMFVPTTVGSRENQKSRYSMRSRSVTEHVAMDVADRLVDRLCLCRRTQPS